MLSTHFREKSFYHAQLLMAHIFNYSIRSILRLNKLFIHLFFT
uniref:Uncharacterized protein n=1 Tax=Lepeophtheirus salmonis TaxID=72036 RepID=A0A0K2V033_LEPSM